MKPYDIAVSPVCLRANTRLGNVREILANITDQMVSCVSQRLPLCLSQGSIRDEVSHLIDERIQLNDRLISFAIIHLLYRPIKRREQ